MSNITGVVRNITSTATNPSIAPNGDPIPSSSTQIGGEDSSGNLSPLQVSDAGRLLVDSGQIFGIQDLVVKYNEVSVIAVGMETSINTYTAPMGKISYLLTILNSGGNRAQYNIYNNGTLFDRQYTNVAQLSAPFDYKTGSGSVPGMVIPVGNIIEVKVTNSGTSTADFNSRFMILEVT